MLTTLFAALVLSPSPIHAPMHSTLGRTTNPLSVTNYGDSGFTSGPWTYTPLTWGTGVTVTSTVLTAGGNPNACQDTYIWFTSVRNSPARGMLLAENANASWTPSTAFDYISMDEDLYKVVAGGDIWPGILLKQDNKYYLGPAANNTMTLGSWITNGTATANANSFNELNTTDLTVNTSSHPNLTTGNAVTMGFYYGGERFASSAAAEGETRIDNWVLGRHDTPSPLRLVR